MSIGNKPASEKTYREWLIGIYSAQVLGASLTGMITAKILSGQEVSDDTQEAMANMSTKAALESVKGIIDHLDAEVLHEEE